MKRILKGCMGLFLAFSVVLTGCSSSGSQQSAEDTFEINVIGWSVLLNDAQVQKIEENTGIKINYTGFNTLEEGYTKLLSGNEGYDLAITGDYMVSTMAEQAMIQELDTEKANEYYSNISDKFKNQQYDPENKYCIPFDGSYVGIMINRDKVDTEITSYADLWKPELAGKIVILDDQRIVMGIANAVLGNDFNETDPEKLAETEKKLEELAPNIKSFKSFDQYTSMLNGEADIMVGWGYEAYKIEQKPGNWEYVYPSEGMNAYVDAYVIPANTVKTEAVYKVLDYLRSDEYVATDWDNVIGQVQTSESFMKSLGEDIKNSKVVNVPDDVYGKCTWLKNIGDDMVIYDDLWTQFKQNISHVG